MADRDPFGVAGAVDPLLAFRGADSKTCRLAPPAPEPAAFSWRSQAYAWWVVVLLAAAFTLSLVDRTILVLFVEPVKHDLAISDTQFSLLIGTAFSLFYVLFGLPMGWLADRLNRKGIIVFSVLGWSLATLGCGWAGAASQLFAGRLGVGVGEAGLAPTATSLVVDYFPKDQVALPLGFLSLGSSLGTGLTMIFGGALIGVATRAEAAHWALLAGFHGWQIVLILLGAFGLLFSLLTFTIREPARTGRLSEDRTPISALFTFIGGHRDFVLSLMVAMSLNQLAFLAFIVWLPAHFIRALHWSAAQTGYAMGVVILIGASSAILSINGWVALMRRRAIPGGIVFISLIATLCALAPALLTPLVRSPWAALGLLTLTTHFSILAISVSATPLQTVAPNELRGQLSSLQALLISVFSSMLGPSIVALLTDRVFHSPAMVGRSIAITATTALLVAALLWVRARRAYLALQLERI